MFNFHPSQREARLWWLFKTIFVGVMCIAAIVGVRSVYDRAAGGFGFDFYQFWLGGDVLRHHQANGRHGVLDLYTDSAHVKIGQQYVEIARNKSRRQREAAADRKVVDTASSPFFYWVFSVVTSSDYDREYKRYILFSVACMVATLAALAWRLKYSITGMAAAIALASISAPVYSDYNVVNFNFPELAICCFYLLLRALARNARQFCTASYTREPSLSGNPSTPGQALRRPGSVPHSKNPERRKPRPVDSTNLQGHILSTILSIAAGVVMGLLAAFKPNLLLFPVLLGVSGIFARRWWAVFAEAGGFAIGVVSAVAVSSWAFGGISCWAAWGRVILDLGSRPTMPSLYGNFSITRDIYEATGRNLISVFSATGIILAMAAIWLGRRSTQATRSSPALEVAAASSAPLNLDIEFRHDLAIFGLAVGVTLLSSGLAWVHYPILLFPFLLLAASRGDTRRIGIPSEIVRYLLLSTAIVLLLFPPPEEIRKLLPFHLDVNIRTWIRCTQAAVLVTFGLALWFESTLVGKVAGRDALHRNHAS